MELTGKTALVTGANRGIGRALVQALLDAGAERVYAAARSPAGFTPPPGAIALELDVTDAQSIRAAAQQVGVLDVLINNAGVSSGQPLLNTQDLEAAEREMRVNYFGTLAVSRAFAPALIARGGGALVNVLSILGRVSLPRAGSYSASKAAAFSLTQGLRAELRSHGTLVIGVLPGFVDTDMTTRITAPKITAKQVADDVLEALRTETEDVYPGPAADIARSLQADSKAVERQLATF